MNARYEQAVTKKLTARQGQCIELAAKGLSSKEIARELAISPSTVDNHIASALRQLNFSNRAEMAKAFSMQKIAEVAVPEKNKPLSHYSIRHLFDKLRVNLSFFL
jgi:DNA-binding CsgD family transcriptional regulator